MDALALIAEAQRRQKKAEADRDHWKAVAASKSKRCKSLVALIRQRPPDITALGGELAWDDACRVVDHVIIAFCDPFSGWDNTDSYHDMTHENAKDTLAAFLVSAVKKAVGKG